jgi:hypothetical protein
MSDGESDDDVQLYSALERNRKQPKRMFGTSAGSRSGRGFGPRQPREGRGLMT